MMMSDFRIEMLLSQFFVFSLFLNKKMHFTILLDKKKHLDSKIWHDNIDNCRYFLFRNSGSKKISQFFVSQFCVSQFWYLVSFFANFVKYYLCFNLRWNRKSRTASRWEQESLRLWLRSDAFGRCSVSRCFQNKVASQVPDEGKIERFQHHFFL